MKQLLAVAAVLAGMFATSFVLISWTGLVTVEDLQSLLSSASRVSPFYVSVAVVGLLCFDLVIAVPTLTVCILAGYFLGFSAGGVSAAVGMLLAGVIGYWVSWAHGPHLLLKIYKKDAQKLQDLQRAFDKHGTAVLLLSRAVPILPEVSCCLAGASRMPPVKFLMTYIAATVPYAFIAAYAGSQSSLANPKPALITAVGLSLSLWLAWCVFLGKNRRSRLSRLQPPQTRARQQSPSQTDSL